MKKFKIIFAILLCFSVLLSVYGEEGDIETYKRELTQELLKNINLKLPKIVQDNKTSNREEIIDNAIKKLETLRNDYKSNDFEYEVINNIINMLRINKSQNSNNNNDENTSSGSENQEQNKNNGNEQQDGSNNEKNGNNSGESGGNQGESQENDDNSQSQRERNGSQIIPKGPSMGLGGEEGDALKPLSEDEKDAIGGYLDSLKQEEKENMRLNKPKRNSNDIFDQLFYFDDNIGGGNYDW